MTPELAADKVREILLHGKGGSTDKHLELIAFLASLMGGERKEREDGKS